MLPPLSFVVYICIIVYPCMYVFVYVCISVGLYCYVCRYIYVCIYVMCARTHSYVYYVLYVSKIRKRESGVNEYNRSTNDTTVPAFICSRRHFSVNSLNEVLSDSRSCK